MLAGMKLRGRKTPMILDAFSNLVTAIKHRNIECEIVVSSALPRHVNYHSAVTEIMSQKCIETTIFFNF